MSLFLILADIESFKSLITRLFIPILFLIFFTLAASYVFIYYPNKKIKEYGLINETIGKVEKVSFENTKKPSFLISYFNEDKKETFNSSDLLLTGSSINILYNNHNKATPKIKGKKDMMPYAFLILIILMWLLLLSPTVVGEILRKYHIL